MVTPVSWLANSMVILLWVMKMNCTRLGHLLHHVAEAPTLASSSGASTSSSMQKGEGLSSEDGEHQGHGGQRLLAAGQQVDGAVALAGRARHDGDAGVEQVLAGQLQVGVAAAEQAREQAPGSRN
jgi:hypothetical protein